MAQTITVTLDESTGAFAVDLNGFNGRGCDVVAKAFEDLGTVTMTKKKPEYTQVQQTFVKAGGGR